MIAQGCNEKPMKVLVLGEDTRSFLSVIRSLAEAGYEVHVACYDKTSPALASKYITTVKYYNYQAYSQNEWLEHVVALVERYGFDLVIPCDERAIYPLHSARKQLPPHTKLAIANSTALDLLFDKWKSKRVAIACHIPVAQGEVLTVADLDYHDQVQVFGTKFVIKPLQSFRKTALKQRQNVAIISNQAEYDEFKKEAGSGSYLIEQFFSGYGEGVSVFAVDGIVHAAFAHRRVAEPNEGGGSSYRQSIKLAPELLAATKQMCEYTALTGVAMFEFRRNPESLDWILVEVNARFWGSLPLAIFSGVNFPLYYADYLCQGTLPHTPRIHYRDRCYARALLPDIYEIRREIEALRDKQGRICSLAYMLQRIGSLSRVLVGRETIDSFSWLDPGPFFKDVGQIGQLFVNMLYRKYPALTVFRRYRSRRGLKRLLKVNPKRRILFVCYGNIMRSPFAELVLRKELANVLTAEQCVSYGFHSNEDRSSPLKACKAASSLAMDLEGHRSKWLRQKDLRDSDIVLYFDEKNKLLLDAYYDVHFSFCLADLTPSYTRLYFEISDPFLQDQEEVVACYQLIRNAVKRLCEFYPEVRYDS